MISESTISAIKDMGPAALSLIGVLVGAVIGATTSRTSSKRALLGTERQLAFNRAAKIADYRQQWINDLRDAMAEWRSYPIYPVKDETPSEAENREQAMHKVRTKILLMMNRNDSRYGELNRIMHSVEMAMAYADRGSDDDPFVKLFQDILKTEWETLKTDLAKATTA